MTLQSFSFQLSLLLASGFTQTFSSYLSALGKILNSLYYPDSKSNILTKIYGHMQAEIKVMDDESWSSSGLLQDTDKEHLGSGFHISKLSKLCKAGEP